MVYLDIVSRMKNNYTFDGLKRVRKQKTEMYATWQIGWLPLQGTWLGSVNQSVPWGPSFNGLCPLKLWRQDFKNSRWSNGKIRFPTKIIYAVHNKLLQINEIKSWISNYEVLFSYVVSECSSSKWDGIMKLSKKNQW